MFPEPSRFWFSILTVLSFLFISVLAFAGSQVIDYSYDNTYQINKALYNSGAEENYLYDVNGNDLTDSTAGGVFTNNPPTLAYTAPFNGATSINMRKQPVISWSGSDSDPGDVVVYNLYFGTYSSNMPCVYSGTAASYSPTFYLYHQTYYWKIIASDNYNARKAGSTYHFTSMADTTPPVSTITSPKDGTKVSGTTCTITGTAVDTAPDGGAGTGIKTVQISIGGGAWQTVTDTSGNGTWATWSYTWTPLPADGYYNIKPKATDHVNNVETPGAGITIRVGNTPLGCSLTYPKSGYLNGTYRTITGTAVDNLGTGVTLVQVSTDGGATFKNATTTNGWANWSYNWAIPADGTYAIQAKAWEGSTNTSALSGVNTVTIDNVPPTLTVSTPTNGATLTGVNTVISGTASDNIGVNKVQISLDGGKTWWLPKDQSGNGSWSTWNYTWLLSKPGNCTAQVRVTDLAGNVTGNNITVTTNNAQQYFLKAWGRNTWGELGDGTTNNESLPVQVKNTDGTIFDNVIKIDAGADGSGYGSDYSVALKQDGTVWTWGNNYDGQLGDGTTNNRLNPYEVSLTAIVDISAGDRSILALKNDGTVYQWGYPGNNAPLILTPARFGNLTGVSAISTGNAYWGAGLWAVLKSNGTVWTWYENNSGQLGDGSTTNSSGPVQVKNSDGTPFTGVVAIAAGGWHMLAIKSDGTLWAWGNNSYGELGDGTTTNRLNPVQGYSNGAPLTDVVAVAACNDSSFAIKSDGTLWAWGNNGGGLLGIGSSDSNPHVNPTEILADVRAVDAEDSHTVALKSDGTVWAWGDNTYGEIGNGTTNSYTPIQSQIAGVTNIAAGDNTLAIQLDTSPPVSVISSPSSGAFVARTYTVKGTASDESGGSGVGKVEVGITPNGGSTTWYQAVGTASWSYSWATSASGNYTVQSRATDNAGNVETPGTGVSITVDNTPPSSTISSPGSGALTGTTCTITGTATDWTGSGVQSVYVSTDGGSTWYKATGTTNWSYLWTMPPSGGSRTIKSCAIDNMGNVETPGTGVTVTVAVPQYWNPDLPHYKWNPALSGGNCSACHTSPGTFLTQGFMQSPAFCYSCHNAAGDAHALDIYSSIGQHPLFVNATAFGRKKPTYGNITAGEYNDIPGSRLKNGYLVTCMTCHNAMRKSDDPGRVWEYTSTSDQYKYYLQNGGWSGYGNLAPKVYRDTSLWSGPTYSRTKKNYLVDPSEYTYNETSGFIRFKAQQSSFSFIYVTLYYPYLRAPMQDNSLCSDCHTEATHDGANCYNCHAAHNTSNIKGIRQDVRTLDYTTMPVKFLRYTGSNSFANGTSVHTSICVVCHTTTKYYRRDGTGFVNHSGGYNYNGTNCTICHRHSNGFAKYTTSQPEPISQSSQSSGTNSPATGTSSITSTSTSTSSTSTPSVLSPLGSYSLY